MNNQDKYISQPLAKKIHDKAIEKGFELPESEYVWVLSKSMYDDKKPEWYLTKKTQTKFFKFYKKPKNTKFEFGKIKLVAKCDYEVISEIIPALDTAELGEILKKAFDNLSGTMINDPRGHFKRLWQRITGFKDEAENRGNLYFYLLDNDLL